MLLKVCEKPPASILLATEKKVMYKSQSLCQHSLILDPEFPYKLHREIHPFYRGTEMEDLKTTGLYIQCLPLFSPFVSKHQLEANPLHLFAVCMCEHSVDSTLHIPL